MAERRTPVLLGRQRECEELDQLLAEVRGGLSAVRVIRGEAGIGKTALLQYCAEAANGFRVVRLAGVESEMELPFAGLHQLCAPMLDRLDVLPEPQRAALDVALGRASGEPPQRFLVALAALGLLSGAAERRPLLCLVDDAQWLDSASGQVLGFLARRLGAEPVAIVFAVREPTTESELVGLPELRLQGLPEAEARALLAMVIPGRFDPRVLDRLVAESRGNPLALLELPRRLSTAQLPGGFGLRGSHELTGRIEQSFLLRLQDMPEDARRLLLVAAAEPADDPLLVWRAAELLGVQASAAVATEAEGMLAIGGSVRFRHPLVRSAIYRSASVDDRRAAHLALAEATDAQADPDRRAWHLAAAAPEPDEQVAADLERSAGRAQARGGLAAAAAFLQRSVVLTRDPGRRAGRALAASRASLHAGQFETALGLLGAAEAGALDELQRARVDLLRAQIVSASGSGSEAPVQLLRAARRLEPLDVTLARETYLDAWGAAFFAGDPASSASVAAISRAARSAPRPTGRPHASDLLLDGLALLATEGRAAAAPVLHQAVSEYLTEELSLEKGLQWGVLASTAAVEIWDFDNWENVITRQMELARAAGALAPLSIALNGRGIVVAWRGDLSAAARVIVEADAVTEATRTRVAPYGAMLHAALRGRESEARARIDTAIDHARSGGEGLAIQWATWSTAVLCNGLGRYDEALAAARVAGDENQPDHFVTVWALPELIEAATRTSRPELCAGPVERLAASANVTATDWGLGILARCRALLATDDNEAERHYREAVDRLRATRLRPELARAHLLYGEWLRLRHRRAEARTQLELAHSLFGSMGLDGFAHRARHELVGAGANLREIASDTPDELTPQEDHIARLAREGRTNVQIGAQLYLSPRTVEWHLKKVFAKLGITSRRALQDALPATSRGTSL